MSLPYHFEKNVSALFSAAVAGGVGVDLKSGLIRPFQAATSYGLWIKAAGTTVRLQIAIEGSVDEADANFARLEGADPTLLLSDTLPHVINFPQINMPAFRVRITNTTGNGADTTITVKLYVPEAA